MTKRLNLESFAAHVEAATRRAGFEIEKRDGPDLYVLLHDEPLRCNLKQVYRIYRDSPDRLDDIVQAHLTALRRVPPSPPPPTEKEAAESLLPILNRAQWLEETHRQNIPPLAHRPFVADLVVTYVFDFPHHRAYMNVDMLAQMLRPEPFDKTSASSVEPLRASSVEGVNRPEVTFDMIHEYALENLRLRTTDRSYEMHGLGDKTMITCETGDGYAATRVLLPDLMDRWARHVPGRMLIGVPNRDFLIAFSGRDPDHVAAIARQVRRDARQRDHPLCADLFVWQDGQIREYRPVVE